MLGLTVSLNDSERHKVTNDTRARGTSLLRFNGRHRKCAHASFMAGGFGRRKSSMRWKGQKKGKGDEGKTNNGGDERKKGGGRTVKGNL